MSKITSKDIMTFLKEIDANIDPETIPPDANLAEHGLDSLDMMNLFFLIEETFGVEIKMDDSDYNQDKWSSMEAIAATLNKLLADK